MALLVPFRRLCQLVTTHEADGLSDAQLLRRFAAQHDEAAFATLLRRHGPLVLRVCRRVLPQEQDAENAFQAAFLVLARKARSIRKGQSLASWLHGVAYRTASNARRIAMRRRQREQAAQPRTVESTASVAALHELQAIVDEEVQRLPEKYRAPLVLCCLEGKSRAEAAAALGWKEGTVSSRLAEARSRLEQRLARRGVVLSTALGAYALAPGATVSARLAVQTLQSVHAFTTGHAVGLVATEVAALAQTVLEGMGARRALGLLALTFGLGLLAAVGGIAASQHGDAQAPKERAAQPTLPKGTAVEKPGRVDRLGDPLPEGAIARLGTVRFRQGDRVSGVAFTPDGRTIASAGWADAVHLWEAATGKELRACIAPGHTLVSVAFSPDGTLLATGCWFGPVILWEAATGKRLREFPGSRGGFSAIAFAPDGKVLAVSSSCVDSVRLFDTATGRELRQLGEGQPALASSNDPDTSVAFSPDGQTLAAAHGPVVRLWQVEGGKLLHRLTGHKARVTTLAFSPDGKLLASAGQDGALILWASDSGKEVRRPATPRGGSVTALAFAADGKLLASASGEGQLCLWDVATGGEVSRTGGYQSGLRSDILSLAFAPKGRMLAAGYYNGTVRAWKLPENAQLLRTGADASSWADHDIGHEDGLREVVAAVAVAPDGKTVATAGGDGTICLWDRASGKPIRRLDGHHGRADGVAFSADGKLLASSGIDEKICLWSLPTGKLVRSFQGNQVAFAPDGKLLAYTVAAEGEPWGSGYRDILLQEAATGAVTGRLRKHPGAVLCLVFSPDGRTLATGGVEQRTEGKGVDQAARVVDTIRLWDMARKQERRRFGGDRFSVNALAFSPDGRTLASGRWTSGSYKEGEKPDAPVQLWETATGKERGRLEGHSGYVAAVAFSRDGRTVAAGGMDRTIRLWEVNTGKQVGRLQGHRAPVTAVAFTPDERAVVSGSWDTTALIWAFPPDALVPGP